MHLKEEKKLLNKNKSKVQTLSEVMSSKKISSIDEKSKKKVVKKEKRKQKVKKPAEYRNVPSKIPKSYPSDLIVIVKNLPENWKQSDIIAAFGKFGSLAYIQKIAIKNALIGFLEPEGAIAAQEARRIFVKGQKVIVRSRSNKKQLHSVENDDPFRQRTVRVFRIDPNTSEKEVRKHFQLCGEINSISFFKRKLNSYFEIVFANDSNAKEALKLHNSMLNEKTIHVRSKSSEVAAWDLKRTIVLLNPAGLTSIEGSKISKIFAPCGEVEKCDVFCYKNRLAMFTFKHENSVTKALSLNGTTKHGLKIEVELYSNRIQQQAISSQISNPDLQSLLKKSKKSKVCIEKVPEGLTGNDIENLFKICGTVESVTLSEDRSAVVEFESAEGYCRAFTLHDCVFGGKKLTLKPYSEQELPNLEENKSQKNGKTGKRNIKNINTIRTKKLRKKA